jgi:carnitine-CoA ligase
MNTPTGDRTTSTFLEYHSTSRPLETALITETNAGVKQTLNWSELDMLVNQTGQWLLGQGLKTGDSFALCAPNCLEVCVFWLAAGKTGMVAVPIDPNSMPVEVQYVLSHSDARLVIAHQAAEETVQAASGPCPLVKRVVPICLSEPFAESLLGKEILSQSPVRPLVEVEHTAVAGMLYTSGTTGKPKGVMLTHAAYLYGAEVFARSTALTSKDRYFVALPLHHAAAQCHALVPSLVAGSSVVIVERFSARRFLQQAIFHRATRAALFAAPLRMLLRHYAGTQPPDTSLQLVTFAQNLATEELREWEEKFRIPLMQLWGMTETVGLPLMVPLHGPRDNMCMGMPVVGYEVRIVDAAGVEVPAGVPGEIVVRGEPGWTVALGYYKNPEATAQLIRDGWLYTGDRALRDGRGQFHFLGRFKELIKRAGENISPLEVEEVLKAHPAVLDAVVLGVPDAVRDERVISFVIFHDQCSPSSEELKAWCSRELSSFKIPEEFIVSKEFPRTAVGKVQRHLLRKGYSEQQAGEV